MPPPRKLGSHGLALWESVQSAYHIDDVGGIELLAQACAAADRVEALAAQISAEGRLSTRGVVPKRIRHCGTNSPTGHSLSER